MTGPSLSFPRCDDASGYSGGTDKAFDILCGPPESFLRCFITLTTQVNRVGVKEGIHWLRQKLGRRKLTGDRGEALAEQFLRRRGFRVLVRNWRNPRDQREEIDLVCQHGELLVFVEVKTRSSRALVGGFDAVNLRKKKILRRAIDAYLRGFAMGSRPKFFRFDIVAVTTELLDSQGGVQHFENVPLFSKHYAP